jgi:hypothetical protein
VVEAEAAGSAAGAAGSAAEAVAEAEAGLSAAHARAMARPQAWAQMTMRSATERQLPPAAQQQQLPLTLPRAAQLRPASEPQRARAALRLTQQPALLSRQPERQPAQ